MRGALALLLLRGALARPRALARGVTRAAPRCADVPRGEGYQVEQNVKVELRDARFFGQLRAASAGLACGSVLQVLDGGGAAWAHTAAHWWLLSRVAAVLTAAARRGQLGAPTCTLLNAGIVGALAGDVAAAAVRPSRAAALRLLVSHALLSWPSLRALRRYGWPRAAFLAPVGRALLLPSAPGALAPLAGAYALLATAGALAVAASLVGALSPPVSSLELVPAAALLALRGAALAGPKRLAAASSLQLNRAVRTCALAGAVAQLAALAPAAHAAPLPTLGARLGAHALVALACTTGHRRGSAYAEAPPPPAGGLARGAVVDVKVLSDSPEPPAGESARAPRAPAPPRGG
ncbi:hypothetical protein KFE25_005166 [Diacronema lutheri]|uniref:Uncharacterized protein n=1 Tax=Diacronema lutheri TaxID=2081491 RepID=A0A8J6C2C2_DIALT|nr:hypothetical protein KFE25_005166 [Diacronema lutheri]